MAARLGSSPGETLEPEPVPETVRPGPRDRFLPVSYCLLADCTPVRADNRLSRADKPNAPDPAKPLTSVADFSTSNASVALDPRALPAPPNAQDRTTAWNLRPTSPSGHPHACVSARPPVDASPRSPSSRGRSCSVRFHAFDIPRSPRHDRRIGLQWPQTGVAPVHSEQVIDRKSTRLNSSHLGISYAVFCLKKKKQRIHHTLPNASRNTLFDTTYPRACS